jgi:hypothetical protein
MHRHRTILDRQAAHGPYQDRRLSLRWTESGGPIVTTPTHRGFGTRILENIIGGQLKGKVRFDWRAQGLTCEIALLLAETWRSYSELFSFGIPHRLWFRLHAMSFQPPIDHGISFKFCIFARSVNPVRTRFDAARMNGDRPQVPLDPRTNSVAHASVFHRAIVRRNSRPYNLKVPPGPRVFVNVLGTEQ